MKRYIYHTGLLILCMFFAISCTDEDIIEQPDSNYRVKPLDINLTLSESGIKKDVNATLENPSFILTIYKNEIFLATDITVRTLTKEEMGNEDYILLDDDQWTMDKNTITFAEDELTKNITVSFKNLDRLEDLKTYVLGISILSSNPAVVVDATKGMLIVELSKGKSGSLSNPYKLETVEDLKEMKNNIDQFGVGETVYFKMQNNIDAASVTDWEPLNTTDDKNVYRKINFDGGGYTISNFSCKNKKFASFFGLLLGSVKNVTFENANIETSNTKAAIVAAQLNTWEQQGNATISKVHVSGTVKSNAGGEWTAGIFGSVVNYITIEECSSSANVTGIRASGMFGEANRVTISSCYFNGIVKSTGTDGDDAAGGIVSVLSNSTLSNCYSDGTIQATGSYAGGLVGKVNDWNTITNSYSLASVEGKSNTGGLAGEVGWSEGTTIKNCVAWNTSIKSIASPKSGRVTGFARSPYGNALVLANCWGRTDIIANENVIITGFQEDLSLKDWAESACYNGKDATKLIAVTKETLAWSSDIWDFSGSIPVLAWQK